MSGGRSMILNSFRTAFPSSPWLRSCNMEPVDHWRSRNRDRLITGNMTVLRNKRTMWLLSEAYRAGGMATERKQTRRTISRRRLRHINTHPIRATKESKETINNNSHTKKTKSM